MEKLAPAKVNLFLKIISKRKDGYHNLLSLFQTISLYDKINISITDEDKIIVDSNIESIKGEKNLCYKVAELFKKKYNFKKGIKIYIEKNIPLGSGLGGASSDAAAVFESLVEMLNIKIVKKELIEFCKHLGKDIPYFFYKGLCLVESTGEKITKIKNLLWENNPLWFVLVYPNKELSTKEVYQKYDEVINKIEFFKNEYNKKKILEYVKNKDINSLLYNDLEFPAIELMSEIRDIKITMINLGAKNVSMSGSGSTVFAVFLDKSETEKFYKKIKDSFSNYKIFIAQSLC
ncbi:MAG: 4-(cytidine 5'-diphospho)-2-C-methyl-D-erythritol kinase [Endomicrobiia bacterium]